MLQDDADAVPMERGGAKFGKGRVEMELSRAESSDWDVRA